MEIMILAVNHGTFAYQKEKEILRDICFSAGPGDLIAVLGPNGSGKTTLLRCIMGFLKWNSGGSFLDGKNIRDISNRNLWQSIAYVPQGKGTGISYTVREMILLGCASRHGFFEKPDKEDEEQVGRIMQKMGLSEIEKQKCTELSGGQIQMVLIARAMAAEPDILILDEPESNLDFKNQLLVLSTLKKLSESGTACIFNTHFPAHAARHANKSLLLMNDGEHLFGKTEEVITEENISKAFGVRVSIGNVNAGEQQIPYVMPVEVIHTEENGSGEEKDFKK